MAFQTNNSPQTLYDFFAKRGENLPNWKQRAPLWESLGLGTEQEYTGSEGQNKKLLTSLMSAEQSSQGATKPLSFGGVEATSSTSMPETQPQDLKSLLEGKLREALTNYKGVSSTADLEVKRQELLRKQLLSAPYSAEGESTLTGAQKLTLMRGAGSQYEPEIKAIEESIVKAKQGDQTSLDMLTKLSSLAKEAGVFGGGELEAPKTLDTDAGIKQWNAKTGQWEDTGMKKTTSREGELSTAQKAGMEKDLRKEYYAYSKEAKAAQRQISLMNTSYKEAEKAYKAGTSMNAASQGVLIVFQKMLDPTSVVRESEYARSGEGQSLLNRIDGTYTKLVQGGAGVGLKELKTFVDLSNTFLANYKAQQDDYAKIVSSNAENYGLNMQNILAPEDIKRGTSETSETKIVNGVTYKKVQGGWQKQ